MFSEMGFQHSVRALLLTTAGIVCGGLLVAGCSQSQDEKDEKILVFAANSLIEALAEVEALFEDETGNVVTVSYGASQALAQQIAQGAPADVYISAGQEPMRYLRERDLLGTEKPDLLGNKLVMVVPHDNPLGIESLERLTSAEVERVALAAPDLAPAGFYAREAMTNLDLWDDVEPKVVIGPFVRAALAYVETGNANVAFVYRTDALSAPSLTVLDVIPPESHTPIEYPAAVVRSTTSKEVAEEFLEFLQSATAGEIFRRYGFEPL